MQLYILILLVIVLVLLLIMLRQQVQNSRKEHTNEESIAEIQVSDPYVVRVDSLFQLRTFEEVLTLAPVKVEAEKQVVTLLNSALKFDSMAAGINIIRFIQEQDELVVTFTDNVRKSIRNGVFRLQKSGDSFKPIAVGKNGRIAAIAHTTTEGRRLFSIATKLSSVLVSVAHAISDSDTAQNMEKIKKEIDYLIQVHKNEKLGKLEAIFKHCQELITLPYTIEVKMALLHLSEELHELRSAWRREMNYNLSNIEDPNEKAWISRMFKRLNATDETIASEISESIADIVYIEASMAIHMALFYTIGEPQVFFNTSLPGELKQFRSTLELLEQKSDYLSKKHSELSAQSTIEYFQGFINRYEAFVPSLETFTTNSTLIPQNSVQSN